MGRKKKVQEPQVKPDDTLVSQEEQSIISRELEMVEKQLKDIHEALESVNLSDISDPEERLKMAKTKQDVLKGQGPILLMLEDLRTRRVKEKDIKGNKSLSPLEDGMLDDD